MVAMAATLRAWACGARCILILLAKGARTVSNASVSLLDVRCVHRPRSPGCHERSTKGFRCTLSSLARAAVRTASGADVVGATGFETRTLDPQASRPWSGLLHHVGNLVRVAHVGNLVRVAHVPSMEGREVPLVPPLSEPGRAQVPVRADLARHVAQ